jgi:Tol biopolymer transport system component
MAGSATVTVAATGLLLATQVQPPAVLMTLQQSDRWRSTTTASASVSADGRYVAVMSYARLVPADTDDRADIYVLDRLSGRISLESLTADGRPLIGDSGHPRWSADGRFLVYQAVFAAEVSSPAVTDIVYRDRERDVSTRITGDPASHAKQWSGDPAITDDGQLVVFRSTATDLVPGSDENGTRDDIFEFVPATRAIRRISVDARGVQSPGGASFAPSLSGDGRWVAFTSTAELDARAGVADAEGRRGQTGQAGQAGQAGMKPQVYVRDRQLGTTRRVSTGNGGPPDGGSFEPAISRDGRFIAFVSDANNLVRGDRNRSPDVFVKDMQDGALTLISRAARGGTGNGPSTTPAISADGRYIAFQSEASDLLCGKRCDAPLDDVNLLADIFRFDRVTERMEWMSALPAGSWAEESEAPQLDASGDVVVFTSRHPIDESDVRNDFDLFVRAPAATTLTMREDPGPFRRHPR